MATDPSDHAAVSRVTALTVTSLINLTLGGWAVMIMAGMLGVSLPLWEAALMVFLTKTLVVHPPLIAVPPPRPREDADHG